MRTFWRARPTRYSASRRSDYGPRTKGGPGETLRPGGRERQAPRRAGRGQGRAGTALARNARACFFAVSRPGRPHNPRLLKISLFHRWCFRKTGSAFPKRVWTTVRILQRADRGCCVGLSWSSENSLIWPRGPVFLPKLCPSPMMRRDRM